MQKPHVYLQVPYEGHTVELTCFIDEKERSTCKEYRWEIWTNARAMPIAKINELGFKEVEQNRFMKPAPEEFTFKSVIMSYPMEFKRVYDKLHGSLQKIVREQTVRLNPLTKFERNNDIISIIFKNSFDKTYSLDNIIEMDAVNGYKHITLNQSVCNMAAKMIIAPVKDQEKANKLAQIRKGYVAPAAATDKTADISIEEALETLLKWHNNGYTIEDIKKIKELHLIKPSKLIQSEKPVSRISDIRFLKHLESLEILNIAHNDIDDLSPLSQLKNLKQLDIGGNNIHNIMPLAELTNLEELNLYNLDIADLSALQNMKKLKTLDIHDTHCDISALSMLPNLESIRAFNAKGIKDLSVFENVTALKSLNISFTSITDIEQVKNFSNLESLSIDGTQVTDISPLINNLNLKSLSISYTQIKDLSPISTLKNLESFSANGINTPDLNYLKELINLKELFLQESTERITDITPLENLINLKTLDISDNNIKDLSPLLNLLKLTSLDYSRNSYTQEQHEKVRNTLNLIRLNMPHTY